MLQLLVVAVHDRKLKLMRYEELTQEAALISCYTSEESNSEKEHGGIGLHRDACVITYKA